MTTITVNASLKYDVLVDSGLIEKAGEIISQRFSPCKICLITDSIVDGLYADNVVKQLEKAGFTVYKYAFEQGEKSKNLSTYSSVIEFVAQNKLSRTDMLVALGGGVVGDLTGFVAATYLRGIRFIQIPTTLLAQIDSSVGGKTAVDLKCGKNLVGAFYQPSLVVCDTNVLKTLPADIFTDGMGEVAKYCLLDEKIFSLVDSDAPMQEIVCACINYKRKIVEKDEFDGGVRKLLNLGHTFAHSIETLSNFKISHGKAVAYGVKIMLNSAKKSGYISVETYNKAVYVVEKCVGKGDSGYTGQELCSLIAFDKKRSGQKISLVEIFGIGDCRITDMDIDKVGVHVFG